MPIAMSHVVTAVTEGPAYHMDDPMAVQVLTKKIPPYLATIGILINEFGNVTSPDIQFLSNGRHIKQINDSLNP